MPATFNDLVALMTRLRSPNGCPWDREQTYATLAPMLLEEAYEAFEAVEEARAGQPSALRDELGDLLFQIIFYAQVAKEKGEFTIDDVTDTIHAKMVRRHPHVFGEARADTPSEVLRSWEAIKAEEKRAAQTSTSQTSSSATEASILDGVSTKVPALMEAHQLSTKAARVGFDWEKTEDIFTKLQEEVQELEGAIKDSSASKEETSHSRIREEIGDLLFVITNIARHLHVEPEAALKLTNRKFRQRFRHIEQKLQAGGRNFESTTLDELESLWQEAKSGQ
ncbi:MAG TPA: nucleoside triphosphate pyrophosphohydrolase [Pyrinomonadaceae bacterium]|nr:nucleoside triphosphate pyrophosphohydrolase [Pyrinomonadaceae bacterium]